MKTNFFQFQIGFCIQEYLFYLRESENSYVQKAFFRSSVLSEKFKSFSSKKSSCKRNVDPISRYQLKSLMHRSVF
ncbi:hypothetical protein LEP1GSC043_2784 [Leptospira weilii str. Ecochallenge]|uniref:Uncharacterized protein n=1 Tax=Leptospira weilii str. Ecochallenge TaxID=1049986 RepID=N1U0S7_9LEPT|nr:hypothetical protein LEP1GSC043_2784 [Leptospira weilii str. Ecochallenge]